MTSNFHKIRNAIKKVLNLGKKNFIIYPYGENGVLTKQILNDGFACLFVRIMNYVKFDAMIVLRGERK